MIKKERTTFESRFFTLRDEAPRPLVPLIDGDIITYRCGFACKDEEPVQNALHSVKLTVADIVRQTKKLENEVSFGGEEYRLFITGKGNFREKIATIQEYKGNRKLLPKPKYYEEIREYMVNRLGAIVVNGMEADDAIGIEQYKNKDKSTCICSIDKDMNMIPGWHYNFVTKKFYYVKKDLADLYFLYQVLQGDRIDNVPGLRKVGPATALKILESNDFDFVKCVKAVEEEYRKRYEGNLDYKSALIEIANLLWIKRAENDTGVIWWK